MLRHLLTEYGQLYTDRNNLPLKDIKAGVIKRLRKEERCLKKFLVILLPEFEIQEGPAQIILVINREIHNLNILV
jgi:hypothetical protein